MTKVQKMQEGWNQSQKNCGFTTVSARESGLSNFCPLVAYIQTWQDNMKARVGDKGDRVAWLAIGFVFDYVDQVVIAGRPECQSAACGTGVSYF